MSDLPRVAIVGGGVAGLSAAVELRRRGCETTVIERDLIIGKSSGLSTGVFTRMYSDPLDIEMRAIGYRRMEELERQGSVTFRRIGYMRLGRDQATVDQFAESVPVLHELGVADAQVLSAAEVSAVVPSMETGDVHGALYSPSDGYLDGHALCQTFAEQAAELGVRILQRSGLRAVEGGGGAPYRLLTETGEVEADVVVNAAGAWADEVGEMLGAPVPSVPIREQVCLGKFPAPLDHAMPFVMDYVPGDPEPGLWLRDEGHGQFLAGLHSNEPLEPPVDDPDRYVKTVDDEFVVDVASRLLERFASMPELGLRAGWTGLYPTSPDGQVMVGLHPRAEQVVVAAGLGGVGIMLSPAIGMMVAELAVTGTCTTVSDAGRLSPARFAAEPAA
jgi:sarcosine oxidase subunit beta